MQPMFRPGIPTHFNPRSREGSDSPQSLITYKCYLISIHAPARGATGTGYPFRIFLRNFNPRSREGSDFYAYKQDL